MAGTTLAVGVKAVGLGIDEGAEICLRDVVVLWHGWLGVGDSDDQGGFGDGDADHAAPRLIGTTLSVGLAGDEIAPALH